MRTATGLLKKTLIIAGILIAVFLVVVPLAAGLVFVPKIKAVTDSNVIGQIERKIAGQSAREMQDLPSDETSERE